MVIKKLKLTFKILKCINAHNLDEERYSYM